MADQPFIEIRHIVSSKTTSARSRLAPRQLLDEKYPAALPITCASPWSASVTASMLYP